MVRRQMRCRGWLLLSAICGLLGCSDASDVPSHPASTTSRPVVVAEIGAVEGPEEYLFGCVVGVAADPDGYLYVLDEQGASLRAYSSSGSFVKYIAREGDGPRELRHPMGLSVGDDSRLYVRHQRGVSVFAQTFAGSPRDSLIAGFGGPAFPSFDSRRSEVTPEGVYYYPYYSFPREGPERFFYLRYVDGVLLPDTLFVPPFGNLASRREAFVRLSASGGRLFRGMSRAPFEPMPVWDVTPRGTVIGGDGEDYALIEVDPSGDTISTIRGNHSPLRVDPQERTDSARALQARLDSLPVPIDRVENMSPWVRRGALPDNYPAYIDVWSGDGGRTWVRRWPSKSGEVFDVFAPDGEAVGSITLPIRLDRTVPPHFRAESVLAVVRDPATDVQMVVYVALDLEP